MKQPVVVENKAGAGGIVALSHVSRQPADGHTVFGLTSSVISKIVSSKRERDLSKLQFVSRLVEDYECLITKKGVGLDSVEQMVAQAKAGKQIWVGPASKGTDHLFAVKFWKAAGVKGTWVPYSSGSEAIAALLGGHGAVYVGNPADTVGRPDLQVIAVASPKRLEKFPNAKTFEELGMSSLTNESLWRGFAVRKGTDPKVVAQLEGLFEKLSKDKEWEEFLKNGNVNPVFDTSSSFSELVKAQIEADKSLISNLG